MNSVAYYKFYSDSLLYKFIILNHIDENTEGITHNWIYINDETLKKLKIIVEANGFELEQDKEVKTQYEIVWPYTFYNYRLKTLEK